MFDGDASDATTGKDATLVKDLGGRTSLHCSFALWIERAKWIDVDFKTDFISIELRLDGALVHREPLGNGTTPRATQVAMKLGGLSLESVGNEFLYDDVRCE